MFTDSEVFKMEPLSEENVNWIPGNAVSPYRKREAEVAIILGKKLSKTTDGKLAVTVTDGKEGGQGKVVEPRGDFHPDDSQTDDYLLQNVVRHVPKDESNRVFDEEAKYNGVGEIPDVQITNGIEQLSKDIIQDSEVAKTIDESLEEKERKAWRDHDGFMKQMNIQPVEFFKTDMNSYEEGLRHGKLVDTCGGAGFFNLKEVNDAYKPINLTGDEADDESSACSDKNINSCNGNSPDEEVCIDKNNAGNEMQESEGLRNSILSSSNNAFSAHIELQMKLAEKDFHPLSQKGSIGNAKNSVIPLSELLKYAKSFGLENKMLLYCDNDRETNWSFEPANSVPNEIPDILSSVKYMSTDFSDQCKLAFQGNITSSSVNVQGLTYTPGEEQKQKAHGIQENALTLKDVDQVGKGTQRYESHNSSSFRDSQVVPSHSQYIPVFGANEISQQLDNIIMGSSCLTPENLNKAHETMNTVQVKNSGQSSLVQITPSKRIGNSKVIPIPSQPIYSDTVPVTGQCPGPRVVASNKLEKPLPDQLPCSAPTLHCLKRKLSKVENECQKHDSQPQMLLPNFELIEITNEEREQGIARKKKGKKKS